MLLKIKVLIYFLFMGFAVLAQNNSLVIFSASGNPFYVTFNGESINPVAQSNVKIFDVNAGWSTLDIKIPSVIKELRFKDSILLSSKSKFVNKEFTYVLIEKGEKLELEFKSVSELSGPKTPPIPPEPKEAAPLVDNSIYGNLYQAVNNKPVFYTNYDKETFTCKVVLTDKEVNYAIKLMAKANDKEAAYRYLTQIIDLNCYNTMQLKELLETAPIDMDRLNSAKKAYSHVTDQQNINTILSVFKYPAMKESYSAFLKEEENTIKQKNLNCKEPANEEKFNALYSKIKNTAYENEKLNISKKLLVDLFIEHSNKKNKRALYTR